MLRLRPVVLCSAVLIVAAVACSSSKATSSTTSSAASPATYPPAEQAVCQARDQLRSSLSALTSPSLLTGGTSGIQSAVNQVQSDLTALSNASQQHYKPEVDALQSALSKLETAVGNLQSNNGSTAQNLRAVGSAIAGVATSSNSLFNKLKATCG